MGRKKHLKSLGLKEKKVKNDGTTFEDIKKNVEKAKKKIQEVSPGHMMMNSRGGRSFGQFHEMLQKAKEGNNVIYASLLGSFEIRYIQPQENNEIYFDEAEEGSDKYGHTVSVRNSKNKQRETAPIRNFEFELQGGSDARRKYIDSMMSNIELKKPIFKLDDIQLMSHQMESFGYKPGEGKERELTHFESFQLLAKERNNIVSEFLLHKFAFFDFVVGIAVGIVCTVLSFLFG